MSTPVAVIGGGMITHDQILPSLYNLQRLGVIGEISVCAQHARTVQTLARSETLHRAFPGQNFRPYPPLTGDPDTARPDFYREVIARLPPYSIVIVATPDQTHHQQILTALSADQHICSVKPLVLNARESIEIERVAFERGLLVAVEYHKRFDDRSFMARRKYREGLFGEFRLGSAMLFEKWYYRHSNFQNWCTTANSDAFSYIGCHYVDLVHFITGQLPVAVSVYGIRDRYPNGAEGYLWTDARVLWNNGACLNVQNGLSFPDAAPGTNTQGLTLYCAGENNGALLAHDDQYRGIKYSYTRLPDGPGNTVYAEPSPDYFQYIDLGGPGLTPVGYGYRSVDFIVRACLKMQGEPLVERRQLLKQFDQDGVLATPANSRYNELVVEAGRLSLLNEGREARIDYADQSVALREYRP